MKIRTAILICMFMVGLMASPVWGDPVELGTWECYKSLDEGIPEEWSCSEFITWADTSLAFALEPTKTITFQFGDDEVVFGIDDFASMTVEEMRNFMTLVSFYNQFLWIDPDLAVVWQKTLLPRFFGENECELNEIVATLKRCREFVDDYGWETEWTIINPILRSPFEEMNFQDESEINRIKKRIIRRNTERQLRQDIETLIKKLEAITE